MSVAPDPSSRRAEPGVSTADQTPPPSRGLKWPVLIIGLLGLNVCVCAITVIAATANPPIVEPDYYEKGLNWDQQRGTPAAATTEDDTAED